MLINIIAIGENCWQEFYLVKVHLR